MDFNSQAPPEITYFGTGPGAVGWKATGGVNDSGFLSLTDAQGGSVATAVIKDFTGGQLAQGLRIRADVRIGGGELRPADGLSFSFARPNDSVLPGGHPGANLIEAEEGTSTGLSIVFDSWDNGGGDVIGVSVKLDGNILQEVPLPTMHGALNDPTSIQTGPIAGPLGWESVDIWLKPDGRLDVHWKKRKLISNLVIGWTPTRGQFVLGARTGGAWENHHVDNLSLEVTPPPACPPCLTQGTAFESDPTTTQGVEHFLGGAAASGSGWRKTGGVDNGGYFALTEATGGQGVLIFPNVTSGQNIHALSLSADLRIGGGTPSPADGISFNFVRPTDDLLRSGANRGTGFNSSPNGVGQNLPEEGSKTGLSVAFDSWDSGAPDVIGMTVRVDGKLLRDVEMALPHGTPNDASSIQTGPNLANLCWVPFGFVLTPDGKLSVSWKGKTLLDGLATGWTPGPVQLVLAARTGGATQAHHIDNLSVEYLSAWCLGIAGSQPSCPPPSTLRLDYDGQAPAHQSFFGNGPGAPGWRANGGVNNGGYLALTDALGGAVGTAIIADFTGGQLVQGFRLRADARIGGGEPNPADGLSFSFARPNDPVLPGGHVGANIVPAEEGTPTGLNVVFDAWDNGGGDVIGISVKLDGKILKEVSLPTKHGTLSDTTSIQTGPIAGPLGWAPVDIWLKPDRTLDVSWKNQKLIDSLPTGWTPSRGQFVLGARTGGAWENHHVDNLALEVTTGDCPPVTSPPTLSVQPKGQTIAPGDTVKFAVTASGAAPLTYQWRKDGSVLTDTVRIVGSAAPNLSISNVQASDAGSYTLVVTNSLGTVTSAPAVLVVANTQEVTLPFLIDGPDSVFFHLFNVLTTGTIRVEVQWEGDSRNLSASLTSRPRPLLPNPSAPHATAAGPSVLSFSYDVTREDLTRGTNWGSLSRIPITSAKPEEPCASYSPSIRLRIGSSYKTRFLCVVETFFPVSPLRRVSCET